MTDIIFALCCGAVGLTAGIAGYKLAGKFKDDKKPYISIAIRQGINIVCLLAAYFIAAVLSTDQTYALLGAAIGIVLSSAFRRRSDNKSEDDKNER